MSMPRPFYIFHIIAAVCLLISFVRAAAQVTTTTDLVNAVNNGAPGATVTIAAGTFELTAPLTPPPNMTIVGAGQGQTIIRNAASWQVGTIGLPDNAVDHTSVDRNAYLIDLGTGTNGITISHLTLSGPELHGAIYGNNSDDIELSHITFDDFLWSSVRIFRMNNGLIHDNTFIDAGGRSNVTSGQTGGAIFITFTNDSEIWNNRFEKTPDHPGNFFGIKGRKATNVRMHHNTIGVSFSIEFPFENDFGVEIGHNWLAGVISIPKFAGGLVLEECFAYHIHHNYSRRSYALEWARNHSEIDHNLFDFDLDDDGGNLISNFGSEPAPGPTLFHNNNIKNPGRGLYWGNGVFNNYAFYNNHVIANTTVTPRMEGLFGFNGNTDFSTIAVRDNIIEINGLARPLMRNSNSYNAAIENNTLVNVSDTEMYANMATGAPRGPLAPLVFCVGVDGEFTVQGFSIFATCPDECATGGMDCTATLKGDMNCDGLVNGADIPQLVADLLSESYSCRADGDENGTVGIEDIAVFVELAL